MVLDFGLTAKKSSSMSHSISNTKLRSLNSRPKKEKRRVASSKDYHDSSSSSDIDSDSDSDDSVDMEAYAANLKKQRQKNVTLMRNADASAPDPPALASAAVKAMLDFEMMEEEIIATHKRGKKHQQEQANVDMELQYQLMLEKSHHLSCRMSIDIKECSRTTTSSRKRSCSRNPGSDRKENVRPPLE